MKERFKQLKDFAADNDNISLIAIYADKEKDGGDVLMVGSYPDIGAMLLAAARHDPGFRDVLEAVGSILVSRRLTKSVSPN